MKETNKNNDFTDLKNQKKRFQFLPITRRLRISHSEKDEPYPRVDHKNSHYRLVIYKM